MDQTRKAFAEAVMVRNVVARFLTNRVAKADYKKYVERMKREHKEPLGRNEWEARVKGKGGDEDEGAAGGGKPKTLPHGRLPSKQEVVEHAKSVYDQKKMDDLPIGSGVAGSVVDHLKLDDIPKSPEEAYDQVKKIVDFTKHDNDWIVNEMKKSPFAKGDPKEVAQKFRDKSLEYASEMMSLLGYEWK